MKQQSKKSDKWSGKSRGGSTGHAIFVFLIKNLGIQVAYTLLALVVIYFIPFAHKATSAIWRYNRQILKYGIFKSIIKLYQHYYVFGQTLIDKIAIVNELSYKYKFDFEDYDKFINLLDSGSVVMIGAHVGCWEIGAEFFGDYASKLNVVMYDAEYEKIKEQVDTSRFGYKIIPINNGGIESLLKIKQAIDNGEYVCFQGDRYTQEGSHCEVTFMGKKAKFPTGPSLIGSKFKTPIIFYFAMRERGRRYRFIFKSLEGDLSQNEILKSYINIFEGVVKKYPQQWFNFYDVWQ